jgi:hypothetical protein
MFESTNTQIKGCKVGDKLGYNMLEKVFWWRESKLEFQFELVHKWIFECY